MMGLTQTTAIALIIAIVAVHVHAGYEIHTSINFHSASAGTTDGGGAGASFFFDVDDITIHKQLIARTAYTYHGTDNIKVYSFIRRNAPFAQNQTLDQYKQACSMAPSPALNMYDCSYGEVKQQPLPTADSQVTFGFPRPGRWFVIFVADKKQTTPNIEVHIELDLPSCTGTTGGPGCDKPIQPITLNGPDSDWMRGTAPAGSYKLYSVDLNKSVGQLFINFDPAVEEPTNNEQDYSGFYMRYGSTPNIYDHQGTGDDTYVLADLGFLNFTLSNPNWIAPPSGKFYIAIYGGEVDKGATGREYAFKLHTEVCSKNKNGGFCEEQRHTVDLALCPKPSSKTCQAPDTEIEIHRAHSVKVFERSWQYMHFGLESDGYLLRVVAQIKNYKKGDQLQVVVNPNGVPEHNGENTKNQMFSLADVYPYYMEIDDKDVHEIQVLYASSQNQMPYYVGLWTNGTRDLDVEIEVKWQICPNNCSSNGTCNAPTAVCFCDDPDNTHVDCANGIPISPSGTDGPKPLGTGAIVALSIGIPLAIAIVVTLIGIGAYTYHKRRNEYEELA